MMDWNFAAAMVFVLCAGIVAQLCLIQSRKLGLLVLVFFAAGGGGLASRGGIEGLFGLALAASAVAIGGIWATSWVIAELDRADRSD